MDNDTDVSLTQVIARLRRAQPRNADTMAVCDGLEARLKLEARGAVVAQQALNLKAEGSVPAKFDRVAYMREYMKRWRGKRRMK